MLLKSLLVGSLAAAGARAAGTWDFHPVRDEFSSDAFFDHRSLNEAQAGQSGFVRLAPDGLGFVLGDGSPVRFWAIGDGGGDMDLETLKHHARWLAKRGVNMVRFHEQLYAKGKTSKLDDADQDQVERCWRLVAAMKAEGIYVTISPYWGVALGREGRLKAWGIEGDDDQDSLGLLFFDKTLQEGYKAWVRALYAPVNPHTGLPLAKDPAVAIIQIQNEDSLLFWTVANIKGKQREKLCRLYGDFLVAKYGSLDKAKAAWEGEADEGDRFAEGRAGLLHIWEMTQERTGGRAKRLADQLEFLARTMYDFNRDMARFYREELGCRQLINAGNWTTADNTRLMDAERWSYTACDVLAVNRYYDETHHQGKRTAWAIDPGDHYTPRSCLLDPRACPVNLKRVVGRPLLVTESHWVPPNPYQSEGAFLVSAYTSLSGVDAYYWFAQGDPEWAEPKQPGDTRDWFRAMGKWDVGTPVELGQWPAAAWLFRRGLVRRGEAVVHEERPLAEIWARTYPVIAEDQGFDPSRFKGLGAVRSDIRTGADPLAFLVGPVEAVYGGDPAKTAVADLSKYVDHGKKTVRSNTGELLWDHGKGVCVLDAPAAQGACGFLAKAGKLKTRDLTLACRTAYASVLVVALDGAPLATSARVLVQLGTTEQPTGWKERDADYQTGDGKTTYHGRKIETVGHAPWQVGRLDATLVLRSATLRHAVVLDMNGMKIRELKLARSGGAVTLSLPPDALYVGLTP
ncbi:MAG: hypothetical protein AAB152_09015 [Candidatus Coatesbacteria bacterium]